MNALVAALVVFGLLSKPPESAPVPARMPKVTDSAQDKTESPSVTLTPDQTVQANSNQFCVLRVQAPTGAKNLRIRWTVIGNFDDPATKLDVGAEGDHVYVGIPASAGEITVIAAVVVGEDLQMLTSKITVEADPVVVAGKKAPKAEAPAPVTAVANVRHVSLIFAKRREADADLLVASKTLATELQSAGITFHVFSVEEHSRSLASLGFTRKVSETPCVILQDDAGRIVPAGKSLPLPATAEELLDMLGVGRP